MTINGEYKVLTARGFHNIAINGDPVTAADAVRAAGKDPETCTVRINNVLVTDMSHAVVVGDTVSVFETKQIASAGAKAGSGKSN
jgi:hypothetical protein